VIRGALTKSRSLAALGTTWTRNLAALGTTMVALMYSMNVDAQRPIVQSIAVVRYKTVDPCTVASPEQLRLLLSAGLGKYFPLRSDRDGEHVTVSKPDLRNVDCPNLRAQIRADVAYSSTRGIAQFEASGSLRLGSPIVAKVAYATELPTLPLTAANLKSAQACLTNVEILTLDIKNVPNWLDNTWMKDWLISQIPNRVCFDVTSLVYVYLSSGNVL
jgi:hypothetical protein